MNGDMLLDLGRMIAALVFVIALMGGFALLLKRLGLSGPVATMSGRKRLKVIESLPLDARRRLVLVQCDDAQHLIVLGPAGETVIKTDIPANDTDSVQASSVDASSKS